MFLRRKLRSVFFSDNRQSRQNRGPPEKKLVNNFRLGHFIGDKKDLFILNGQEKSCHVCSWMDVEAG